MLSPKHVLALLVVGCTTGPVVPTVQTVCEDAATQNAPQLAKLAAGRGVSAAEMQQEFVTACVSRLTADLQEIPADLAAISNVPPSDAGADQ